MHYKIFRNACLIASLCLSGCSRSAESFTSWKQEVVGVVAQNNDAIALGFIANNATFQGSLSEKDANLLDTTVCQPINGKTVPDVHSLVEQIPKQLASYSKHLEKFGASMETFGNHCSSWVRERHVSTGKERDPVVKALNDAAAALKELTPIIEEISCPPRLQDSIKSCVAPKN